jgi:hypothetical protein
MRRVKCLARPEKFSCVDNQITPGKFYTVITTTIHDDRLFYTIIGDDGVEVDRPTDFFRNPNKSDAKKRIKLHCGVCHRKVQKTV